MKVSINIEVTQRVNHARSKIYFGQTSSVLMFMLLSEEEKAGAGQEKKQKEKRKRPM